MISIVTAIHNGLAVNKIFLSALKKYTHHPHELIIVDNASTDGSADFFEKNGAKVIRNKVNYSYPYSQNQGLAIASFGCIAFLNNDIIVCPGWDKLIMDSMAHNQLDVITCCGVERLETPEKTKSVRRRWKLIKNFLGVFGYHSWNLRLMHKLMYGNWEAFCRRRAREFHFKIVEGFVGNTVVISRKAIEKIGPWDERIQAADFDYYLRTRKRFEEVGDIKPMHIALDVYNHHFIRITVRSKPTSFADADKLMALETKWTEKELTYYLRNNVST